MDSSGSSPFVHSDNDNDSEELVTFSVRSVTTTTRPHDDDDDDDDDALSSVSESLVGRRREGTRHRARGSMLAFVSAAVVIVLLLTLVVARRDHNRDDDHHGDDDHDDGTVLHVHLVPHTHDDVGWLKTVEQCFLGTNETLQANVFVKEILDSTIQALLDKEERRFTYVEMAFFARWWDSIDEELKINVRGLVKDGRLSFANGGWCMHDEAATHFTGMLDQTTRGHDFLKRKFNGYTPKVGWQLDPFGHSYTQGTTMTTGMAFDAIYFGRIDYQDRELRIQQSRCEGLWGSSGSNTHTESTESSPVFWGLTGSYDGNYGPPKGFCVDTVRCGANYDQIYDYNEDARMEELLEQLITQANRTQGQNILLTMGSDFNYQDAEGNFKRMESVMKHARKYQQEGKAKGKLGRFSSYELFYSTPELYTKAKHKESKIKWELKTDDFFPYADNKDAYWTGYFTSRPLLKKYERDSTSFLHTARILDATLNHHAAANTNNELDALEDAVATVQHHDGISGTSKQHVAQDYAGRLSRGMEEATKHTGTLLAEKLLLLLKTTDTTTPFSYCPLLNVSSCPVTQEATAHYDVANNKDIYITVVNALAANRKGELVAVPVTTDADYEVLNLNTKVVTDVALLPSAPGNHDEHDDDRAPYLLWFDTGTVPAAGAVAYRIRMRSKLSSVVEAKSMPGSDCDDDSSSVVKLNNGKFKAVFEDGRLRKIQTKFTNGTHTTHALKQSWAYYTSYAETTGQNSGAYIFRPNERHPRMVYADCMESTYYETPLISEVRTRVTDWIHQIIRLKRGTDHIEVEFVVGPIPGAKEVVALYSSSNVDNNGVFYTDSNGRDFIRRERNTRGTWDWESTIQPVAGNYYPVNAAIVLEDRTDVGTSLSVLTDRSQGGASLSDGTVELMVHRRTLTDDHRGVGEPLNETDGGVAPYPPYGDATRFGTPIEVTGVHHVLVGGGRSAARRQMDATFSPLRSFFLTTGGGDDSPFKATSFSALKGAELPSNLMLITLQRLRSNTESVVAKNNPVQRFLVRVGHQYGEGEDDKMSSPVRVHMKVLFPNHVMVDMVEKTLSNNQARADWEKRRLRWNRSDDTKSSPDMTASAEDGTDEVMCSSGAAYAGIDTFTVRPMKICTFEVSVIVTKTA